jgi:hypothetical protein
MVLSREYASPGKMKEKRRRRYFPVVLEETAAGDKTGKVSSKDFSSPPVRMV